MTSLVGGSVTAAAGVTSLVRPFSMSSSRLSAIEARLVLDGVLKSKAKLGTRGSIGQAGNTKGGSIIVPLTSCLTGLELAV